MFEILAIAFLAAMIVWFFPAILAFCAVVLCLVMAALCWILEQLSSLFSKKPK